MASGERGQGLEEGISQVAVAGNGEFGPTMVWNFPLAVTWKSSTPFGWPQVGRSCGVFGSKHLSIGHSTALLWP